MARKTISDISSLLNIALEGNLIAPATLAKVERLEADGQSEKDYDIKPGLTIRDEIPRAFRIGQALFSRFAAVEDPNVATAHRFVSILLRDVFGYHDLLPAGRRTQDGRDYLVHFEAGEGRVPVIIVPPRDSIDRSSEALAFDDRKRSASTALQDWLNAEDDALWGLAANGEAIRLMRDNASLTRPAFVEANLKQIFETEDFSSFSALWLLIHRTRFGNKPSPVTDCALEQWRDTGSKEGAVARDRLRDGVEEALKAFGSGFLEANPEIRQRLTEGDLKLTVFFNELLRIIYRLIFLMVAEDRNLLHDPEASGQVRQLYFEGYSLKRLRERSVRRSNWDKHRDLYEGLKIVFRSLATGETKLGLPALGGLFDQGLVPDLDVAALSNRALMEAVYRLAWLKERDVLVPINWREMETEELGSVYESLLELTPRIDPKARRFYFAEGEETKGNQRKKTSSYYTPDSLVQALLDTTLDPVLDRAENAADDPETALLRLTAIDPACGSGHFLLATARRIATRVARVRSAGVASASDYRSALRDVVRMCIYGVDRNPMAVELTHVALWIETIDPGKPLGFLDANIRCGDALLGVFDFKSLRSGIPDKAYTAVEGDSKEAASYYKTKNRREISERDNIESGFGLATRQSDLSTAYAALHAEGEDLLEQVERKRKRLRELLAPGGISHGLREACNIWTAAWFVQKFDVPERGKELVPTSGQLWEFLRSVNPSEALLTRVTEVAHDFRFFHWPVEFPEVFGAGGFDIVVGNPPWDQVALQDHEFFASRDAEIARTKKTATRKKLIAALDIKNPTVADEYRYAVREVSCTSHFIRTSDRYPLGGVGKVNTYAVFADLFRQALHPTGRAGVILPNGLVTGFTYREFLKYLLENRSLVSFYGFENEDKIFRDVHNETKFGLLTICGVSENIEQAWLTAHIRQPAEIHDSEKRYALTVDEIAAINPNTMNLPTFRWSKDAEITAAIHKKAPILKPDALDHNIDDSWRIEPKTGFNMSSNSDCFIDHSDIAHLIETRDGVSASLGEGRTVFPLYEGKMFWHFDHRYGTYECQTQKQANKGVLPRVTGAQHSDPSYRIQPRYWVTKDDTEAAIGPISNDNWFYSWRDVGPSERTFVGTIIPRTAVGDVAPVFAIDASAIEKSAFCAICSSLVVDYAARQKSNRMSLFVVNQLPILTPDSLNQSSYWLNSHVSDWLSDRVLELCYTNEDLKGFATDLGRTHLPFIWNSKRRTILQGEIDAAVLHLYDLNRSQAEWLLDSFTVLRKYEERDFGTFRTKNMVLDIYDQMADARTNQVAYQTTLSPLPADPILCHGSAAPNLTLPQISEIATGTWAWPSQDERDRIRTQLRAMVGVLPGPSDTRRVRLATLACLHPDLLNGYLAPEDRIQWQRIVGPQAQTNAGVTVLTPPTNAAWGSIYNELVSGAVLDVSNDGTKWGAGPSLNWASLRADDPAVGRALFAWSRLNSVNLDVGLPGVSTDFSNIIYRDFRAA